MQALDSVLEDPEFLDAIAEEVTHDKLHLLFHLPLGIHPPPPPKPLTSYPHYISFTLHAPGPTQVMYNDYEDRLDELDELGDDVAAMADLDKSVNELTEELESVAKAAGAGSGDGN